MALSFLSGFCMPNIEAQLQQKNDGRQASIFNISPEGKKDTLNNMTNTYRLYGLVVWSPVLAFTLEKPDLNQFAINNNNYSLIKRPSLSDSTWTVAYWRPEGTNYGVGVSIMPVVVILSLKPDFTKIGNNFHSSKSNQPSIYDHFIYRSAGILFHFYKENKYPSLFAPQR